MMSTNTISSNQFKKLQGSKKERCEKNLTKLRVIKEKLIRSSNDYEKTMNTAYAVINVLICSLSINISTQKRAL